MSTLTLEHDCLVQSVEFTEHSMVLGLTDGRTVSVPLTWYPRLNHGSLAERTHWELIGDGEGIHWPDLDEDISLAGILAGRPSAESQTSLKRWLQRRAQSREL